MYPNIFAVKDPTETINDIQSEREHVLNHILHRIENIGSLTDFDSKVLTPQVNFYPHTLIKISKLQL